MTTETILELVVNGTRRETMTDPVLTLTQMVSREWATIAVKAVSKQFINESPGFKV